MPRRRLHPRRQTGRSNTQILRFLRFALLYLVVIWFWIQLAYFSNNSPRERRRSPVNPLGSFLPARHSCDELFGKHQIISTNNGTCLEHALLKWVSCKIGSIQVDSSRIEGSLGGEPVDSVLNRPEDVEKLTFHKGALILTQQQSGIEDRLKESVDKFMKAFLGSAVVQRNDAVVPSTSRNKNSTLIVRRGNYANSCMTFLTMYNVYTVMEHFRVVHPTIIWLDGHAHGDLDGVWEHLFETTPIHVKQLANNHQLDNAIVVNTMSAIGDEGIGKYGWKGDSHSPNVTTTACPSSTLVSFRDFVLDRYGITRSVNNETRRLTFLVRKDYVAHPRSNGRTDRTLANPEDDVAYIQSQYPTYFVQVVSFEGLSFEEQLSHITQSDVFISVHGAGNIHTIFLPDHATFVEYFPKGYELRKRFRYLAECSNVTYVAKRAWIKHRFDNNNKVSLRLRPVTATEIANEAVD
jgi:hypothetical protein